MKFLFIVQGEGRGHLTQAITLEDMLQRNGHEVVEVLVGKSSSRTLPGFFNRSIHAPVKRFISPNFLPTTDNKRVNLKKSLAYNLLKLPEYFRSMYYINQRIKETGAEVVINFYELLTGLTYAFFRPSVPYICMGHQYLFLHRDFQFPDKSPVQLWMLRFFTRMTALRSSKKLALSFREMERDDEHQIVVVPPLIRREITAIQPEEGNYIHGYMVNAGFADTVDAMSSYAERERRLEILKDPHTGAFAIIGLCCYFLANIGIWSEIGEKKLLVACCIFAFSRAMSGLAVVSFKAAKNSGLLRTFQDGAAKRRVRVGMMLWAVLTAFILLKISPAAGTAALAMGIAIYVYYYLFSRKYFGGTTGDLAGYFLQLCELGMLAGIMLAG